MQVLLAAYLRPKAIRVAAVISKAPPAPPSSPKDRVARASSKFCAARGAKGGFRWRDLAMVRPVG